MLQPPDRGETALGDCILNADKLTIECGRRHIELEPKVFGLLHALAAHPARYRSRTELMEALWPRVHVVDNALSRCAYQARRAIGEVGSRRLQLETRRNLGYRLTLRTVDPAAQTRSRLFAGRRASHLASGLAAALAMALTFTLAEPAPFILPKAAPVAEISALPLAPAVLESPKAAVPVPKAIATVKKMKVHVIPKASATDTTALEIMQVAGVPALSDASQLRLIQVARMLAAREAERQARMSARQQQIAQRQAQRGAMVRPATMVAGNGPVPPPPPEAPAPPPPPLPPPPPPPPSAVSA